VWIWRFVLRSRSALLVVVLFILVASLSPGVAGAASTVSGSVTRLADGTGIQGAAVTLAGPDQPPTTAATGPNGGFSIDASGSGSYSVQVSAPGFRSQAVAGVAAGAPVQLALSPSAYVPLGLYDGSSQEVVADVRSGTFYSLMRGAQEVYRTVDYGGSWQPVTMSYDDPANGLTNLDGLYDAIAVSGVSGEVAVAQGFDCTAAPGVSLPVSVSTDYGLTWRRLGGASWIGSSSDCGTAHPELFWGHGPAGGADVLMLAERGADGSWSVWRADMSAATPVFVKEPSDPFGTGSQIAAAQSPSGAFIGRVSAAGALSFAPLTASGPISFGPDQASGLPTPPVTLRLGGAQEASAPPDGALAIGGTPGSFSAVMATKSLGAASFDQSSLSTTAAFAAGGGSGSFGCSYGPQPQAGAVAPTTTGSTGSASADACWLEKKANGQLVVTTGYLANGGDLAFDAGYGQNGDYVSIIGGYGTGPIKFSGLDSNGIPTSRYGVYDNLKTLATAGTDPLSSGFSVTGITSPVIQQAAFGPVSGDLAVAATFMEASKDAGRTFALVEPWEGHSAATVQWWQGASGEWLVYGYGGGAPDCKNMLGALFNWDGTSASTGPNVAGSTCAALGGQPQDTTTSAPTNGSVTAMLGVPGTDTVFLGTHHQDNGDHLYRAQLTPGSPPGLTAITKLDPSPSVATMYMPMAMAYCPASSADVAMRDVLFVGTAGFNTPIGSLLRITGATGQSPSASLVSSIPHDAAGTSTDHLRADCTTGVVYAAESSRGLYKSLDGGQTFSLLTISGPDGKPVNNTFGAIGVNPADPADVTLAIGSLGALYHSADGGATWTLVRDPTVDRASAVSDIEFPPGSSYPIFAARDAQVHTAGRALIATSDGLFSGDLTASAGLFGVSAFAGRPPGAAFRITTSASDGRPVLITPPRAVPLAVFRRRDGLAYALTSNGRWSQPVRIPGTGPGADTPVATLESGGAFDIAYQQTTGRSQGIYFIHAAAGRWSAPKRLGTVNGDNQPSIAATGKGSPQVMLAFVRTRGSTRGRGIYTASLARGKWSRVTRIPTRGSGDSAPALAARGSTLDLVFARSGRKGGIYLTTLKKSKWTTPQRLTTISGDGQPAIVIDNGGITHIVFRRASSRGARGLFELVQGRKRWSLRQIPRTTTTDQQAAVSVSGGTLQLAFARPSGAAPGIYFDQAPAGGRWPAAPRRFSDSARDKYPAVRSAANGPITLVFERS